MIIATSLLLFSFAGFLWVWIGYPLHLRSRRKRWSLSTLSRDHRPAISIIIAAFNQESVILRKLRNTLALDYPRELMEVLVVSDGSTDRTEERVARVKDKRVRLVRLPRTGRLAALQQGVLRAHGEIIVFTDANVSIERSALKTLMRNFADPNVGGATAAPKVRRRRNGDAMAVGESAFARYDNWVRGLESSLGSVYAADRGLYAIRRTLVTAPRSFAQSDDMVFSTGIVLSGKRLVHEPNARCRRDAPADGAREMRRRVHAINYALCSISEIKWKLLRKPRYAMQLLSHTIARSLSPLFLVTMLVCSAMLAPLHAAFVWVLGAQAAAGALALFGWKIRRTRVGRFPLFSLPAWFASFNVAAFLGLYAFFVGRRPAGATPRKHAAGRAPFAASEARPILETRIVPSYTESVPQAVGAPPVSAII
jgi:cellulose synthase/poly-beta-1,6-N-acetylglucosamine synthase-like glycosyltransferase